MFMLRKTCALSLAFLLAMSGASHAAPGNPLILDAGNGLAVTTQPLADMAGQMILDKGGNAIDAAVAVGYALAVVHPQAGNIGGGGFAVIHTADGKDYALDFRETAPGAATRDMYLDAYGNVIPLASTRTYKAAGVPGTVAGMSAMLDRFGTMKLADVMATAIELAEKGYPISERQARVMAANHDKLSKFPTGRKYFLHENGTDYRAGEIFVQSDLAETLKRIAAEGPKGFYEGRTAELIEADMKANDGLITREDLLKYEVKWREPSTATYRGYKIVSMCPPSSGGAVIAQILNVMENADMRTLWAASPADAVHVMAEAMRQAYADRSEYMGDPDFVNVPVAELTSKEYARKIFDRINPNKATPSDNVRPGLEPLKEGTNTTHYSVVDKAGNAVSVTYTINESWGTGAAVDGAGFLLNNEMDDFSVKPGVPNVYGLVGGDANAVAPYKRPLSSMSPSIVSKEGKTVLVVGSPGGARIITTVLQVIANVVDRRMALNQAVSAPRYHMQWLPDELRIEPGNGLSNDDVSRLVGMGYTLSLQPFMGDVNAIMIDPETGKITGSHDSRHEF
ncbi:MAG: gamma-glutamyltransferase [Synergistaceae bacterium]|nr:gamma-glutamyltransferase [Synergistaceae bacterium]